MDTTQRQQRLLLVLFTDWFNHKEQRGDYDVSPDRLTAYRQRIARLVSDHQVRGIAEEMNWDSMVSSAVNKLFMQEGRTPIQEEAEAYIQEHLLGRSIPSEAELVAQGLGLTYMACDLTKAEQLKIGPLYPSDKTVEARIRWEDLTFPPREEAWIAHILHLDGWPVLFICGSDHRRTFLPRLEKTGLEVVVLPPEVELSGTEGARP